jgi:hypothetical protein
MIRPFITDEADFLDYARQRARLDELILRQQRAGLDPSANDPESYGQSLVGTRDTIREAMRAYDEKHNGDRKGTWIPLFSGTRYWPESPAPRDIDIRDIAHSLARINRWNGHTRNEFSVAQHSVMVSRLLPKELQLFGLLHDAGEAFLGDIITPVKRLFRRFYEDFEEATMQCVARRFGFDMSMDARDDVKRADLVLLATEVRDLVPAGYVTQGLTELPLDEPINVCWGPWSAEDIFLEQFARLTGGRWTEGGWVGGPTGREAPVPEPVRGQPVGQA